jgi:hypothetical protein
MFNSKKYWESRYFNNGNSGLGSYNKSAQVKADYVNSVIEKYNIKTISDYGHGDGNQLTYLEGFKSYYGYDVSETIRKKCIETFTDTKYNFVNNTDDIPNTDLAMSLDVVYHLIEDDVYIDYLTKLFSKSKYVIIYSSNYDKRNSQHVYHRKFTDYVNTNINNFTLIDTNFPYTEEFGMFLYERVN